MVGMTSSILRGRQWSRADRDRLPDDGFRYEVADGALVVTPAPTSVHQIAVFGLYRQLFTTCPGHLRVVGAPLDVILGDHDVLQPDLLVAARASFERHGVIGRPELAVEVLSPGSQVVDRNLKFDRYERAGTPAYWLADPDALTLTAYELRDGRLVRAAHVTGDESWAATVPYPAVITPATWLE